MIAPSQWTKWDPARDLRAPFRWRKSRRVLVSIDLFAPEFTDTFIDEVWAVMALCPRHTFMVSTKHLERMGRSPIFNHSGGCLWICVRHAAERLFGEDPGPLPKALRNVWLGVRVEDQKTADARIPLLLEAPAAVRFVTVARRAGELDLSKWPEVLVEREPEVRA